MVYSVILFNGFVVLKLVLFHDSYGLGNENDMRDDESKQVYKNYCCFMCFFSEIMYMGFKFSFG